MKNDAIIRYDEAPGSLPPCPPVPSPEIQAEKLRELLLDIVDEKLAEIIVTALTEDATDEEIPSARAVWGLKEEVDQMSEYAEEAAASAAAAAESAEDAETAQSAAEDAAAAAASSATAADASADAAAGSATAAGNSATAAAASATQANSAKIAAQAAQAAAEAAVQDAEAAGAEQIELIEAAGASERESLSGYATRAETAAENAEASAESIQGSVSDAAEYATAAGESATAAAASATQAVTAKTAAQTAKTAAETAQAAAEAAQGDAEAAATAAETAQEAAEAAQTAAESAQSDAEDAATAAGESATAAGNSATYAGSAATAAGNAATYAENKANLAGASAEAAAASAAAAEAAATDVLNKATVITDTASGAIASFPDGADEPIKQLTVNIEPKQDLHGYDNPWPAGGGKNLFDKNAVSNGSYNPDSGASLNYGIHSDYIKVTPGQSISQNKIKATAVSVGEQTFFSSWTFWDSNKQFVSGVWNGLNTVTVPDNASYLIVGTSRAIGTSSGQFTQSTVDTFLADYIIAEGATIPTFAPYSNECPITGWTGAKVVRTGVNIWDEQWEVGTISVVDGEPAYGANRIRTKNYIACMPSTSYYVVDPTSGNNIRLFFYAADKSFISVGNWTGNAVLTTPSNCRYIKFIMAESYGTTYQNDISINYPSTDHNYHAYTGASYPITWQTEAGTVYGGTLTVEQDGTGTLVVTNEAYAFDGTEDIALGVTGGHNRFNASVFANNTAGPSLQGYCSHLKYSSEPVGTNSVDLRICCFRDRKNVYWRFDAHESENDMKSYLAQQYANGTPMTVVCPLATPITYTLTAPQMQTLLGQNNWWADTGDVSVDYRADTKLYIDKKLAALLAALS